MIVMLNEIQNKKLWEDMIMLNQIDKKNSHKPILWQSSKKKKVSAFKLIKMLVPIKFKPHLYYVYCFFLE